MSQKIIESVKLLLSANLVVIAFALFISWVYQVTSSGLLIFAIYIVSILAFSLAFKLIEGWAGTSSTVFFLTGFISFMAFFWGSDFVGQFVLNNRDRTVYQVVPSDHHKLNSGRFFKLHKSQFDYQHMGIEEYSVGKHGGSDVIYVIPVSEKFAARDPVSVFIQLPKRDHQVSEQDLFVKTTLSGVIEDAVDNVNDSHGIAIHPDAVVLESLKENSVDEFVAKQNWYFYIFLAITNILFLITILWNWRDLLEDE